LICIEALGTLCDLVVEIEEVDSNVAIFRSPYAAKNAARYFLHVDQLAGDFLVGVGDVHDFLSAVGAVKLTGP
jgi:hypothetical protein